MAKASPDFSALPVKIERTVVHPVLPWIAGFVGLASILFIYIWFDLDPKLVLIIAVGVVLVVVFAPSLFFPDHIFPDQKETITIHQDHVEVTRTGKFGDAQWTAPISSFHCVLWKRTMKRIHRGKSVGHVIEMTHFDPGKSIVLHAGYDRFEAYKLWSEAAERLKLPQEKSDVNDSGEDFYVYLQADDHGQGDNGDGNGNGGGNGGD